MSLLVSYTFSRRVRQLARALGMRYCSSKYPRLEQLVRRNRFIINWGWSGLAPRLPVHFILNSPTAVGCAANKLHTFQTWWRHNLPTVPWTNQVVEAQAWADAGNVVIARQRLTGHSGEGIEVVEPRDGVVRAPLYTKYIPKGREFRVHVGGGEILFYSQKKRRDGFLTVENHDDRIRNYHTGWVYTVNDVRPLPAIARTAALQAISALQLDFGAVDLITKREGVFLLEVNTAPGILGTTTYNNYYDFFLNRLKMYNTEAA